MQMQDNGFSQNQMVVSTLMIKVIEIIKLAYFWYGMDDLTKVKNIIASKPFIGKSIYSTGKRGFSTFHGPKITGIHVGKYSTRAFSSAPKRVGLIGARGYTGAELISLLDAHPNMEIAYVSSREMQGKTLKLQSSSLKYSNLSPQDAANCKNVDAWIMALPNKVCEPWVKSILSSNPKSVIVDLSADYRYITFH